MRKIIPAFIIITTFGCINNLYAQDSAPSSSSVSDYKFAAGIRFSSASPTLGSSFSVKYFINDRDAIEGLVSFEPRFAIGGLFERHQLIGSVQNFTWFYGGGGYVGFENNKAYIGPTGVLGVDYKFQNAPINLSIDWKPELDISPAINFVPDAFAITARFVFK